ncbi:lycopene cyclase domain-containing protein [Arcticibacter sp. MXS-1]|uniref:lycopene cyclase domain-containing protein n=1 Tax=Arcticibacter sp. MXS-1 TaxID=3341726 RepID=UPI0035A97816
MNSHYTYLLINFLTVFFPVVLSFDKRVQFYKSWKYIFPGLLLTGVSFLVWDYLFTIYDVWSFNPDYVIGVYFLNLPLEEILFFITVPFACIFIYACLNYYVKRDLLKNVSTPIVAMLALLSLGLLVAYYDRVYTLITFSLLLVTSIYIGWKRPAYIGRFLLAYIVSLLPFYIVNGVLTALPVVIYNDAQNVGLRVGTVPFEDHFYSFVMLYFNIAFFEYFRQKKGAVRA